jgi:glycosyltransferase involved in cell wall biosynthesis
MTTLRVAHLQRKPFPGYYSIEGQFAEIRKHMPPGIVCTPWVCPHFSKGVLPRLSNARAAARVDADVFHVTGDVHYLTRYLPRERTILTVHDCVFLRQTSGLRRLFIRKMFYEWAVPRAAVVTVISEATRRELSELVPAVAGKLRLIPCCVGDEFTFSEPREWPEKPTVLMVGTKENKNIVRMVQALAGLPARIHIVGKLEAAHVRTLETSKLDWRNSPSLDRAGMVQAYRDCDLLGFASTYEGFGLPIVEAQAVGRPVLTSNVYSMPEACGSAAVLVDPLDVAAIRIGWQRLLQDAALRADLIERGRDNAAKFGPARIANLFAELYQGTAIA